MTKRYFTFNITPYTMGTYSGSNHVYFAPAAGTSVAIERVDVGWNQLVAYRDTFLLGLYRNSTLPTEGVSPAINAISDVDENIPWFSPFNQGDLATTTAYASLSGFRPWEGPWCWSPALEGTTAHSFDVSQFGGFEANGDTYLRLSYYFSGPYASPEQGYRMAVVLSEDDGE